MNKEKISYNKKYIDNEGTLYNQTIKVDYEVLEKILKAIIEEKSNKYCNYKKYCCNGISYSNMFLFPINEFKKVYCKNGVNFFLNITTTSFIKYILKNNRIKTNKNTILFYSYDNLEK